MRVRKKITNKPVQVNPGTFEYLYRELSKHVRSTEKVCLKCLENLYGEKCIPFRKYLGFACGLLGTSVTYRETL